MSKGYTLVIDGTVYGNALTLSEAQFIAGPTWTDKDRTKVWQNDAEGNPMKEVNHAGTTP